GSHGTPAAGGRGGVPPLGWDFLEGRPLLLWDSLDAELGREKRVDMLAQCWYDDSASTLTTEKEGLYGESYPSMERWEHLPSYVSGTTLTRDKGSIRHVHNPNAIPIWCESAGSVVSHTGTTS